MDRRCSVFFFQAEDGIRDYKVTGVQTCALPISRRRRAGYVNRSARRGRRLRATAARGGGLGSSRSRCRGGRRRKRRSEERRVGKEWSARPGTDRSLKEASDDGVRESWWTENCTT